MHAPSLHKWHIFDWFFEYHQKLGMTLLILILIGIMYGIAVQLESIQTPQINGNAGIPGGFFEAVRPLTHLLDPQYVHEYLVREQYLIDHLEDLRNVTQAERVYVVLYSYVFSRVDRGIEPHVSHVFEVAEEGIPSNIETFQGISRHVWLQLKQEERSKNGLFAHLPKRYGRELYNEHNVAIGYLGLEKQHDEVLLPEQDSQFLRETAGVITNVLVQPIEQVKDEF